MNQTDAKKSSESPTVPIHVQPVGPRPAGPRELDPAKRERPGGRRAEPKAAGRAATDEGDKARMSSEGGTEGQVGDTSGPGAGYDGEPAQVKDEGGVL
jgi:hypothetical protein